MRSGSGTSAVIHRNTDVFSGRLVRRLLLSSTFRGGLRRDAVVAVVQTAVNTRRIGNLWQQPLSGEQPTQLTHFNEAEIFYLAMSADGSHMAIVRGTTVSDVVLLTSADGANH